MHRLVSNVVLRKSYPWYRKEGIGIFKSITSRMGIRKCWFFRAVSHVFYWFGFRWVETKIAQGIARGELHPMTHEPFHHMNPSHPSNSESSSVIYSKPINMPPSVSTDHKTDLKTDPKTDPKKETKKNFKLQKRKVLALSNYFPKKVKESHGTSVEWTMDSVSLFPIKLL